MFEDYVLPYALHGVEHLCFPAVDEVYFSKSALTYYLNHFKIVEGRCVCLATSVEKRRRFIFGCLQLFVTEDAIKWSSVQVLSQLVSIVSFSACHCV